MADTVGKAVNGFQLTLACLLIACPAVQGGDEQSEGSSRGLAVENRNENAPFMVRVSVDHADHIYQIGDVMHVSVRSEQPGYLYLFYI
ncbi:MAG: hypothetical protein KDA85_19955, partial [Planctomycetaceae bacterium]|nr:hypothetical protein [Planctomycetaceae bacterium]